MRHWQVLTTDFSARAAAAVMNRLAKLSARFIGEQGFSIGIDDVTPAHELQVQGLLNHAASRSYYVNALCIQKLPKLGCKLP